MWATVLVVYFIKFVYTVCMEGNYFRLVTTSEAVKFLCEGSEFMCTRCLIRVHDKKHSANVPSLAILCIPAHLI